MKAVPIHAHHEPRDSIHRRAIRRPWSTVFAVLCAFATVGGCGGGGSGAEPDGLSGPVFVSIYETDFSEEKAKNWLHYPQGPQVAPTPLEVRHESDGNHYAVSEGPWWTDPNHAPPGLGYLHLVAFAYHRGFPLFGEIPDIGSGSQPMDLRNAQIAIRWRARDLRLPAEAQLALWFQSRVPVSDSQEPRYVNFINLRQPLQPAAEPGGWQEDEIVLTTAMDDYACLGSNPDRTDMYGCDVGPLQALRDWDTDIGLVIFFEDPAHATEIAGAIELDHLEISVPAANLSTHGPADSLDGDNG